MQHWPRHLLALITLVAVVLLVFLDLENTSPGPLSAAHEQVDELRGSEGCALCHGPQEDSQSLACRACHETIDRQLAETRGFHGQLGAASECATCHLEHVLEEVPLVSDTSFLLAGVPVRTEYAHAGLDFELAGSHNELSCSACHVNSEKEILLPGERRYLGLDQGCASCHEPSHPPELGENCQECHSQEGSFDQVENYAHTSLFPLTGAHEDVGCYACHEPNGPHSVTRARQSESEVARDCGDCHTQSHSTRFLEQFQSRVASPSIEATCSECHEAVRDGFTRATSAMPRSAHEATGFPLELPHAEVACDACHGTSDRPLAASIPRAPSDCAACHDDPHGAQFLAPEERALECRECHEVDRFQPHGFDVARHALTAFPLEVAHSEVQCSECHQLKDGVREFRGTSSSCADCHEDPHAGQFSMPGERALGCADCHEPIRFEEHHFDESRHASTAFPLTGAHLETDCNECHTAKPEARSFRGTSSSCVACHTDPHGNVLADDCATCHGTHTFAEVPATAFIHGRDTGFELSGAHERGECTSCHVPTSGTDAVPRRLGRVSATFPAVHGRGDRCDRCHVDVHGGMLRTRPLDDRRTDCSDCHTQESFVPHLEVGFEHGAWTGFPLEGAHAQVRCEQCHPASPPDPGGRTSGRALGQRCSDCHLDPHLGQFETSHQNDCRVCHSTASSFGAQHFDHDRDSRFPLDETHAALECSACHRPWNTASGVTAVRYRPLQTECAGCHLPEPGGPR